MTDSNFRIHVIGDDDLDAILDLDGAAFGYDTERAYFDEVVLPGWDRERFIAVRDADRDDDYVASAGIYGLRMTFPGGRVHPVAGVTWVAVKPGEQRRGILTRMMRHQLDGLHDEGEAVAALTASEAGIYGRFGYGLAVERLIVEVPGRTAFRPGTVVEAVRQLPRDQALPVIRQLYEDISVARVGYLDRSDANWDAKYSDHASHRDGATVVRFAVHPDGYVSYRIKSGWGDRGPESTLSLIEIQARTAVARASLWRHVLDYALIQEITYRRCAVDEPLRDLVADVRSVKTRRTDHIWLRLVDLDRAIPLRGYRAAAGVTIELTDAFCPWNAGRWRLELDTDGGTATRTTDEPEIRVDTTDLAACFFGGTPLTRLADAGRVQGDPAALERLALSLSTPLAPTCPDGF